MIHIYFLLGFILWGLSLNGASGSPSRLQLLRQLERAKQPEADSPKKEPETSKAATTGRTQKKGRPPLPTVPPKSLDFTQNQSKMYDMLIAAGEKLKQPLSYADGAKKIIEIINGKLVGTDYRTTIKQRPELQQTLLAVILSGLDKDGLQTAKQNKVLTDAQYTIAVNAGKDLLAELNRKQWMNLDIPKNTDLKNQYLNASDLLGTYTDEPLSAADSATLSDLDDAVAKSVSTGMLFGGAAGASAAVATIWTAYKKYKDAQLIKKSAQAADVAASIADLDVPEELTKDDKEKLTAIMKDIRTSGQDTLNQEAAAKLTQAVDKELLDITDEEDPTIELNKLLVTLSRGLESSDIKTPTKNMVVALTKGCARLIVLISILLKNSTRGGIDTVAINRCLNGFTTLPPEFFAGVKASFLSATITPAERDNLIASVTALITGSQLNKSFLGITNTSTFDATLSQFAELQFCSDDEQSAYKMLSTSINELKATLQEMALNASVMTIQFKTQPLTSEGRPLTFQNVIDRHTALKDIPGIEKLKSKELFIILMQSISKDIAKTKEAIISNEKLYTLLLSTTGIEPEEIPQRIRKLLGDQEKTSISTYFAVKEEIRSRVNAITNNKFSQIVPTGTQKEVLIPIYALSDALYVSRNASPLVIKPKLFKTNDLLFAVTRALQNFINILAENNAAISSTIQDDVTVRNELYTIQMQGFTPDFFTQAFNFIDNDILRFRFSECGYMLYDMLLGLEGEASEYKTVITTAKEGFKTISITPKYRSFISALTLYIDSISGAVNGLTSAPKEEHPKLITQYKEGIINLSKLMGNDDAQVMACFNYFVYNTLFPNNMLFLTDVPEAADPESIKATVDLLKTLQNIIRNIDDSNTVRAKYKPVLQSKIQTLLKDAEKCDLSASEQLAPEVQSIYILLTGYFLKFKKIETYLDGLMGAYAILKEEKNRTMIGSKNNAVVYHAVFSRDGVFNMPETMALDDASTAKLDPLIVEAGFVLYKCLKDNPNDLSIKDDTLSLSFINKFFTFFDSIKNKKQAVATTPEEKASAQKAEAAVKEKANVIADTTKADPNAAAATQLLEYIKEHAKALLDKKTIGEFAKNMNAQLNSSSKRKIVAGSTALKSVLFSPQGLLVDPKSLPTFIKPDDLDEVIKLYKILQDNPNDLGIKVEDGKKKELDPTQIAIKAIVNTLEILNKQANDDSKNYEDIASYEFEVPDADGSARRGYMTIKAAMITGKIPTPEEAMGPKIKRSSLEENDFSLKQMDLYDQCYEQFKSMRAPFMAEFMKAFNILSTMTKQVDNDETFLIKRGALGKALENRRLLNKKPLEDAFHETMLDIKFLPQDIAEADFDKERSAVKAFYQLLIDNPRKYEMRTEHIAQAKNIIGWIEDPSKAPTVEQQTVLDGGLQFGGGMGMGMNPMMMGGMGMGGIGMGGMGMVGMGSSGKGAQGLLGLNSSGGLANKALGMGGMGMGMNPMMSGMGMMSMNPMMGGMGMMGMNPMMGGMGMGMNPMMMGGMMPGMMGAQQQGLTKDDVAKAVEDARNKDLLDDLKDRARMQDMLAASGISIGGGSLRSFSSRSSSSSDGDDSKSDGPKDDTVAMSDDFKDARVKAFSIARGKLSDKSSDFVKTTLDLLDKKGTDLFDAGSIAGFCESITELIEPVISQGKIKTASPFGYTADDKKSLSDPKHPFYKIIWSQNGLLPDLKMIPRSKIDDGDIPSIYKLYKFIDDSAKKGDITFSSLVSYQNKQLLDYFKKRNDALAPEPEMVVAASTSDTPTSDTPAPVAPAIDTTPAAKPQTTADSFIWDKATDYVEARKAAYTLAESAINDSASEKAILLFLKQNSDVLTQTGYNAIKMKLFCDQSKTLLQNILGDTGGLGGLAKGQWTQMTSADRKAITNPQQTLYQLLFSEFGLLPPIELLPASLAIAAKTSALNLYSYLNTKTTGVIASGSTFAFGNSHAAQMRLQQILTYLNSVDISDPRTYDPYDASKTTVSTVPPASPSAAQPDMPAAADTDTADTKDPTGAMGTSVDDTAKPGGPSFTPATKEVSALLISNRTPVGAAAA